MKSLRGNSASTEPGMHTPQRTAASHYIMFCDVRVIKKHITYKK